jgi:hypothetical protein
MGAPGNDADYREQECTKVNGQADNLYEEKTDITEPRRRKTTGACR